MKKLIFMLGIILIINSCDKDENIRKNSEILIFTENFKWQTVRFGIENPIPPDSIVTYHIDTITCYFAGDTLIENVINNKQILTNYKLIRNNIINVIAEGNVNNGGFYHIVSSSGNMYNSVISGFIRTDNENKKVYYRTISGNETLLYDFNMNIGDTVDNLSDNYNHTVVKSIDTLVIGDYKLKRFNLFSNYWGQQGDFIIGIGSSTGIPNFGYTQFVGMEEHLQYFEIEGKRYTVSN